MVDQRVIAGVGNIYADEICFDAGLRPDRPGGSLKRPEITKLTRVGSLCPAISYRGARFVPG